MTTNVLIYTKHYTVPDTADYLRGIGITVSADTVQREIDDGRLGCRRIRGKIFVGEDQIEDYLQGATACPRKNEQPKEGSTKSGNIGSTAVPGVPSGTSAALTSAAARSAGDQLLERILKGQKAPSTNTSSSKGSPSKSPPIKPS